MNGTSILQYLKKNIIFKILPSILPENKNQIGILQEFSPDSFPAYFIFYQRAKAACCKRQPCLPLRFEK
jgi:hypothetical protein